MTRLLLSVIIALAPSTPAAAQARAAIRYVPSGIGSASPAVVPNLVSAFVPTVSVTAFGAPMAAIAPLTAPSVPSYLPVASAVSAAQVQAVVQNAPAVGAPPALEVARVIATPIEGRPPSSIFDGTALHPANTERLFLIPVAASALVVPLSSSFHELGHYLATRAVGRTARMRVNKVLIQDHDSLSYPRRLMISLAGPAFNFLLAGATAVSALTIAANPWVLVSLWLYTATNVLFGATNLMPFKSVGIVGESGISDGAHARDEWRAWRAARSATNTPTRANLEKDDRRASIAADDGADLDQRLAALDAPAPERAEIAELVRRTDALLPEAFAAGREAMARALGKKPYAEQVMAAVALHRGRAVEQKTGEGKTLSIGLAAYLNALSGCQP